MEVLHAPEHGVSPGCSLPVVGLSWSARGGLRDPLDPEQPRKPVGLAVVRSEPGGCSETVCCVGKSLLPQDVSVLQRVPKAPVPGVAPRKEVAQAEEDCASSDGSSHREKHREVYVDREVNVF